MSFGIFTLIVAVFYILYFTLMLSLDAAKFRKSVLVTTSVKQDFVVPQIQHIPVKVSIQNNDDENLPQLHDSEDEEKPEELHSKKEELINAGSNLFQGLGIETITDPEPIVVDAEALNFMLS